MELIIVFNFRKHLVFNKNHFFYKLPFLLLFLLNLDLHSANSENPYLINFKIKFIHIFYNNKVEQKKTCKLHHSFFLIAKLDLLLQNIDIAIFEQT